MIKKLIGKSNGCRVHKSQVFPHAAFETTPLSVDRQVRVRNLPAKSVAQLRASARHAVQKELECLKEECTKLRHANALAAAAAEKDKNAALTRQARESKRETQGMKDAIEQLEVSLRLAEKESERLRKVVAEQAKQQEKMREKMKKDDRKLIRAKILKCKAFRRTRNLRRDVLRARESKMKLAVKLSCVSKKTLERKIVTRTRGWGRPYAHSFEKLTRRLLATGDFAESCRNAIIMCAEYFLENRPDELREISAKLLAMKRRLTQPLPWLKPMR